jgi:hypothetical protein
MSEQVSSGDGVPGTADGPFEVPGHAERGFDWPVALVLLSSIALVLLSSIALVLLSSIALVLLSSIALAYLVLLSAIYVVLAALL